MHHDAFFTDQKESIGPDSLIEHGNVGFVSGWGHQGPLV